MSAAAPAQGAAADAHAAAAARHADVVAGTSPSDRRFPAPPWTRRSPGPSPPHRPSPPPALPTVRRASTAPSTTGARFDVP